MCAPGSHYSGHAVHCMSATHLHVKASIFRIPSLEFHKDLFAICCFDLLFHTIATVFQLYHGGDMMYAMRRIKPEPKPLLTQGIFSFPHDIGMVREELAFVDDVSYTQRDN